MSTEGSLRRVGRIEIPVRHMPREKLAGGCRTFKGKDFEASVAEDVIERMLVIGRAQAPNEWMGILLGHVGADDRGDYAVVRAVVHDHDALARPGFIESTHASEARTRLLARLLFPDLVCLGWAHGHVRCGAFFSGQDLATQATWTAAGALGVVVDPWDPKELAVFRGPEGERLTADKGEGSAPAAPLVHVAPSSCLPETRGRTLPSTRSRLRRLAGAAGVLMLASIAGAAIFFACRLHLRVRAVERLVAEIVAAEREREPAP